MTSESSLVRTYGRTNRACVSTCGRGASSALFIHDGAVWETFSSEDLTDYLAEGAEKASTHLARISDLTHPYTTHDEQELFFMVESLVHARHALEETSAPR